MPDAIIVLGVAFEIRNEAVTASRVLVQYGDGVVKLSSAGEWHGTPGDEARSSRDLHDALANLLDRGSGSGASAIAVKRTESTQGRPTRQYDMKLRTEGIAMMAAASHGWSYRGYRTNQLTKGDEVRSKAVVASDYPANALRRSAIAAACELIAEILESDEV